MSMVKFSSYVFTVIMMTINNKCLGLPVTSYGPDCNLDYDCPICNMRNWLSGPSWCQCQLVLHLVKPDAEPCKKNPVCQPFMIESAGQFSLFVCLCFFGWTLLLFHISFWITVAQFHPYVKHNRTKWKAPVTFKQVKCLFQYASSIVIKIHQIFRCVQTCNYRHQW